MRNTFLIFSILLLVHCSKKSSSVIAESEYVYPKYDTIAVDSFSNGAMSVDVAEQIRKSSFAYQDSIRKVRIQLEEERLAREEKAKQKAAEEAIKKQEMEKKRKLEEEEKRQREQEQNTTQKKDTVSLSF